MVRSLAGDEPKPAVRGGGHAAVRGTDVMTVEMVVTVVVVRHGLIRRVRSTEFSVMPKLFSRTVSASVSSAFEALLCYVRRRRARSIDLVTSDSDVDTVYRQCARADYSAPHRRDCGCSISAHTHKHTHTRRRCGSLPTDGCSSRLQRLAGARQTHHCSVGAVHAATSVIRHSALLLIFRIRTSSSSSSSCSRSRRGSSRRCSTMSTLGLGV